VVNKKKEEAMNFFARWGVFLGVALLLGFVLMRKKNQNKSRSKYLVGIVQIASHPALDAVVESCKKEMKRLESDISFIEQNAQGSINSAYLIAKSFARDPSIDLVVAIATPAAQAAAEVLEKKPMVFAAVSDPVKAGLTEARFQSRVTGVSDSFDLIQQILLIESIAPEARSIGLLYNKGEVNAMAIIHRLKPLLEKKEYVLSEYCFTNEAEVPQALASAAGRVDLLLAPIDNTVASSIDYIARVAAEKEIPLIVSDVLLVKQGALAAAGVDYSEMGKMAGQRAIEILTESKKVSECEIMVAQDVTIAVHQRVAEHLGIDFDALKAKYGQALEVVND
jgi:putative ABC transport system substrate-binding protein